MLFIIIILLLVFCAIWAIVTRNKMVGVFERKKNALSQISIEQKSRWDALSELVKLVRSYKNFEKETLTEIVEKRKGELPKNIEALEKNEKSFRNAMDSLNVVMENYPDLKSSEEYKKLMESVNSYENKVRLARSVYNDMVTRANQMVKSFPSSIVANFSGFYPSDYLEFDDGSENMPNMGDL